MADRVCHAPSFFSTILHTEILSTETSDVLKQIILTFFSGHLIMCVISSRNFAKFAETKTTHDQEMVFFLLFNEL